MNMIRSCLLQYDYSFKSENNGYSLYMNNTFYGHAPNVNGLLIPVVVIHMFITLMPKDVELIMIVPLFVALPLRSYWCKVHEEPPC